MKLILLENLKSGGGKVVGLNYLEASFKYKDTLFILPNDIDYKNFVKSKNIENRVLYYSNNIRLERIKFLKFNKILKENKVTSIINFTNIPLILNLIPQTLFLHKAQFLINIFKSDIKFPFKYRMKTYLEQLYIKYALKFGKTNLIVVQTNFMKNLFEAKYKFNINSIVVPSGNEFNNNNNIYTPKEFTYFFVPTSNAVHKDLETLINVASKLENSDIKFKVTLRKSDLLLFKQIPKNIELVGKIDRVKLRELLDESCGIFLPTLLESFCLPYVEALSRRKKVITTDLEFAREICGNEGFYFEAKNSDKAVKLIEQFYEQKEWIYFPENYNNFYLIDWEESFKRIYSKI